MKKILAMILAVLMLAAAAGCSSGQSGSGNNSSANANPVGNVSRDDIDLSEYTLGVCIIAKSAPFWVTQADKCVEFAAEYGMKCIVVDGNNDASTQVQAVEDLIAQNVDAIIIEPVDPVQLAPVTRDAQAAGIPVINISSQLDDSAYYITHIDCDNEGNCMMLGQYIAEKFANMDLKIGILSGVPGHINGRIRRDSTLLGIIEYQLQNNNEVSAEIVTQGWAYWAADTAVQVTEDMMTAAPDMNLIIVEAEDMARGAAQAVAAAGMSDKILIAVCADGSQTVVNGIMDGTFVGSGVNSPVNNARLAVDSAVAYFCGEQVPTAMVAEAAIITPENAQEYYDPDSSF